MPISGVLFDFYDTLVEEDVIASRKWIFLRAMGYECSYELQAIWDPDGYDGLETPKITDSPGYVQWRNGNIEKLALQSGVTEDNLSDIVNYIIRSEKSFTVRAKKGAVNLINSLRNSNIPIGICSNWDEDILTYLNQSNLPIFDTIITSAEVGARKPHPKPFIVACESLGTTPSETLFVGDSWKCDITGAIRSGLIPVWLTSTLENPAPKVVHIVHSLEDVLSIVYNNI